jgi:hypothetical protein
MYHQHQHELRDGTGEREEVEGAGSAMRMDDGCRSGSEQWPVDPRSAV